MVVDPPQVVEDGAEPPTSALAPWQRIGLWTIASLGATGGIAWIALQAQYADFAPLGLFPVLVGIALGASLAGLARCIELDRRGLVLIGAAVCGFLIAFGQDVLAYRDFCRRQREEIIRRVPLAARAWEESPGLRPNFVEFVLAHHPHDDVWWRSRRFWWLADPLLVAGAAIIVVWLSGRGECGRINAERPFKV